MIAHWGGRFSLPGALIAAVGLLTVSCEKVPLLAPSSASITLTALATALPINGTTDLIVQVLEQAGTPPHSGTHVTFMATLGSVQPSEAETDLNGRVVVKFLAGTASGTATITASSGGAGSSGATSGTGATATDSRTVKIAIGAAAVGGIAISANPSTVSASGGTSTIVARVNDPGGNPLSNVPVTFTTDAGSVSASVVSTDASGNAQTTLTTNKTAKVTAAAGVSSASGTTTTGAPSASVTVTVNTTAAIGIGTGGPTPSAPTVGQTVSIPLTYSTTGGSAITRVIVDWGDGSSAQTFSGQPTAVSHAYSASGSYLVRITGVDAFGDTSNTSVSIAVANRPAVAVTISASANPTPNTTTTFTIAATPTTGNAITSIKVDFGDGTQTTLSGNATSVQHVYGSAGTYTATAVATDSGGLTGSASTVIVVGGGTTANYTISPSPAKSGQTVTFNGSDSTSSSPITTYTFDFGDGFSASGSSSSQTHVYVVAASTNFTTRLTIQDSAGRTATKTQALTVSP